MLRLEKNRVIDIEEEEEVEEEDEEEPEVVAPPPPKVTKGRTKRGVQA